MKFWLTRTTKHRVMIEAPTREAVKVYSDSDAWGDYLDKTSASDIQDDIISAANSQRSAGITPDIQIDAAGEEIEVEE